MLSRKEQLAIIEEVRARVRAYAIDMQAGPGAWCVINEGVVSTWCRDRVAVLVERVKVELKRHITRSAGVFRFTRTTDPAMAYRCRIDIMPANARTAEQFRDTVIHEFAHALVYWVHGPDAERDDHGQKWVQTMKGLGVADPYPRCRGEADPRYYVQVKCACPPSDNPALNRVRHTVAAKIRSGKMKARCLKCMTYVELVK